MLALQVLFVQLVISSLLLDLAAQGFDLILVDVWRTGLPSPVVRLPLTRGYYFPHYEVGYNGSYDDRTEQSI
jgi:hypothetical protein